MWRELIVLLVCLFCFSIWLRRDWVLSTIFFFFFGIHCCYIIASISWEHTNEPGWVGLINNPAQSSSSIVQTLESMGAVLYVKTNIPQSLMVCTLPYSSEVRDSKNKQMSDSYNHVFGQSVNAFSHDLISGGSSGGEGALIASGGSILGIGTDIGGSIRIPANLQGLYSITPTTGRVPWDCSLYAPLSYRPGIVVRLILTEYSMHQHYLVPPVAGPMARSLSSVESFMENLLGSQPWNIDPGCIPIPWRKELATPPSRKLKLGFVFDDGMVRPQPPVARALRETASKLAAAGHEGMTMSSKPSPTITSTSNLTEMNAVVEWDTSLHIPGTNLWTKAILADGGHHCKQLCDLVGEPLVEGMVVGSDKDLLSIPEREELEREKWSFQTNYLRQWLNSGIDALILPVLPWVGYKPKTWVTSKQWLGYTAIFNLLNYAAVTVPVAWADEGLDQPDEGWTSHVPRNASDEFNYLQCEFYLFGCLDCG